MNTKKIVFTALFAAILCILSPISVPAGPIPVTLSVFALFLTASVLPPAEAFFAVLVYILLGALGLPVFSGFNGGFHVLTGATGGYIIAYPFMALIVSICSKKGTAAHIGGIAAALLLCYAGGTLQYSVISGKTFSQAAAAAVIPFIIPDIIKSALALLIGKPLKKACASFYKG